MKTRLGSLSLSNYGVGYLFLALLVMGPMLLKSGFVLTLDMVFTPKLARPVEISNTYFFQFIIHFFNVIVSGEIVEKTLIFSILFLCGYSMHALIKTRSQWPRYFGGIFYIVNPFTYERWMAGQYLVVAGYALLPLLVKALLSFFEQPGAKKATPVVIWYSLIAILSLQNLVLGAIIGVVLFCAFIFKCHDREKGYRNKLLLSSGLLIIAALVVNSYWLIGTITGHSTTAQSIDSFSSVDLKAFATASNPHAGLFFNVLSMYGFWLERYGRYAMPNHNLIVWLGGFVIIAALVIAGAWSQLKKHDVLSYCLVIVGVLSLVMSMGVYAPITGATVHWIIDHVPLMKGFREPEKFSALLVLAYAYFAAYGLDLALKNIKSKTGLELVRDGAIVLPLIYTSTMLFGSVGQLKPVNYPASWYAFNNQLRRHPATGKLLFLPWHEYMSYDFSPRIIANPAPDFFTNATVIAGTNAQFGGLNDPHPIPTSEFIENQVLGHTTTTDLGRTLARIQVQYVLLAHGYDYNAYGWVQKQTDLKLLSDRPGLEVFLNEAYHGRS